METSVIVPLASGAIIGCMYGRKLVYAFCVRIGEDPSDLKTRILPVSLS